MKTPKPKHIYPSLPICCKRKDAIMKELILQTASCLCLTLWVLFHHMGTPPQTPVLIHYGFVNGTGQCSSPMPEFCTHKTYRWAENTTLTHEGTWGYCFVRRFVCALVREAGWVLPIFISSLGEGLDVDSGSRLQTLCWKPPHNLDCKVHIRVSRGAAGALCCCSSCPWEVRRRRGKMGCSGESNSVGRFHRECARLTLP